MSLQNQRQQFMLDQIQKGDTLLHQGGDEQAAFHYYNAVRVVERPQELLALFQQSLPAHIFELIVNFIEIELQKAQRQTNDID